jgi:hypothetical protein
MSGVWKKTLTYLGLVEDDEFEEIDEVSVQAENAEIRRFQRPQAVREVQIEPEQGTVRTIPSTPRPRDRSTSPNRAGSTRRGTSRTGSRTGSRSS